MLMTWLRRLHAWIGFGLCLLVAAVAFSGAVLAYKPAIVRATVAGAKSAPDSSPAALARAMAAAEAEFGPKVTSVTFASDEVGLHQVYMKSGGGFLDQSGAVAQRWGENERAVDWLFELHRGLMADETGDMIVGWIGVILIAMTVSGLVLWWPTRRSFGGHVLPGNGRAGWLRAHRDIGVMSAPFILVLALTGAALDLPDVFRPLMNAPAAKAPKLKDKSGGKLDWAAAVAAAQAAYPTGTVRMAVLPAKGGPASIRLRRAGEWHVNGRTILYFDPKDSRLIGVADSQKQSAGGKLFNAFWPLHAAKVGGPLWRFLVCLSGLALGVLSLYGAEAYRRKLFAPGRRKPALA